MSNSKNKHFPRKRDGRHTQASHQFNYSSRTLIASVVLNNNLVFNSIRWTLKYLRPFLTHSSQLLQNLAVIISEGFTVTNCNTAIIREPTKLNGSLAYEQRKHNHQWPNAFVILIGTANFYSLLNSKNCIYHRTQL